MFDKEQFISDCREALIGDRTSRNVREVVKSAIADSSAVIRGLGEPKKGGLDMLHRSNELTVLNVLWPAGMIVMPHNHALWAVIGVYNGREDNILWRRLPYDANGRIEAAERGHSRRATLWHSAQMSSTQSSIPWDASPARSMSMAAIFSP